MEEKKEDNKKKVDLKKYGKIQDTETVDLILAEMRENKIFPSDALKGVILQNIGKVKVQKYLVEKFQEVRDKIEHKTSRKNNSKETK